MTSPIPGKLAYLTGEYPRATDTFIQREVAALRDQGFDVLTCSIRKTGPEHIVGPEQQAEQAQTYHVLPAVKTGAGLKAQFRAMRDVKRYFGALRLAWQSAPKGVKGRLYNMIYLAEAAALSAHMQDNGVTHLHNHIAKASCTVAMLASHLSGVPYSFTLHGPDIFYAPEHWRLDKKIETASFVACISEFCRSQAMLWSETDHWNKLHIVHCGIDPAVYADTLATTGKNLLFVGRLASVKGVPILLDALAAIRAQHPDMHLTLIGDGPERTALEARAAEIGLDGAVTFAGYKSQAEVADALAQSDALILPSFAEGVPVVLMEAMAAARPVVATRVGGVAELVEDGVSGFTVAPGDPVALAVGILDVLDASPAMGAAGRAKVAAEFNIATEAAWLGQLIAASPEARADMGKRP